MRTAYLRPRQVIIGLLCSLVCMLSACSTSTTTIVNGSNTPGITSTVVPGVTPTAVPVLPTSTSAPHPMMQAQIVTKLLANIGPSTNSTITDLVCPAGFMVAGGGVNSGYSSIVPMQNAPLNATTWRAEIFNTSSSQTIAVQVQVDCLKVTGATLTSQIVAQSLGSIASGGTGTAHLTCPSGYVVAGGGFNSGYPTFNVVLNVPQNSTTWQAEVYNKGASAITLQAQVVCLAAPGLSFHMTTKSLGNALPTSNSSIADTACPAGFFVGGGGLNAGGNYSFIEMWDAPTNTQSWRSEVYNESPIHTLVAQTQFVCLGLS